MELLRVLMQVDILDRFEHAGYDMIVVEGNQPNLFIYGLTKVK